MSFSVLLSFKIWTDAYQNVPKAEKVRFTSSWKLLHIKVTPNLQLTYSKKGGNLGLVLKMKNVACISILLTKHVKYTY